MVNIRFRIVASLVLSFVLVVFLSSTLPEEILNLTAKSPQPTARIAVTPTSTPVPTSRPANTPIPVPIFTPKPIPTGTPTPLPLPPNHQYSSISVIRANTETMQNRVDLDMDIRGYRLVDQSKQLVSYSGDSDPKAPQFSSLFSPPRDAAIIATYENYNENGALNQSPAVTLIDLQTTPGENIVVPNSGYDIGSGFQVMVLYAADNKVTLKYTREDDVISGYAIYIENLNINPNLVRLYDQLNNQGRTSLPALKGGELLGTAAGNWIRVAIRDTGSLMDPRSKKDWWRN